MMKMNLIQGTCRLPNDDLPLHKVMKRVVGSTILIFLFFFSVCSQAWSGNKLFFQDVDPGQLETAVIKSDIVTRIRPVVPNVMVLTAHDQVEFVFNCFDDVFIKVSLVKQDRPVEGQTLWLGSVKGLAHSSVLLVSNGETVSGEITGPDFHFQIRPWQEGIHIIREMLRDLSPPATAKLTGNISFENQVIELTNQERVANSLQAYSHDAQLTISARGHATDMASSNYFNHTSLDGRSPFERMTDAGYVWNAAGENIAAGQPTAVAVVNSWMNSEGHRNNILSSTFCDIGVGYAFETSARYGHYWVQNFGRKRGVSVCPPPVANPVSSAYPVGALQLMLLHNPK